MSTKPKISNDPALAAATEDVFFRDALMHSPFGVFITTPAGRFVFANHAMAQILGYESPEELISSVTDIATQVYCDPEDRNNFLSQLETRDELADQESRVRKKDGCVIWLAGSTQAVRDETGTIRWYRGYVTDISARKLAEKKLRESEERYRDLSTMLRLICDNVPDMIWAKNLDKEYTFANKAICAGLLGAGNVEEPIGKTDLFFAQRERTRHADNPSWHTFGEICRDTDQITMDAGRPQQFDEYGNVQGKFLFLDVCKAPLLDEDGVMIGTVGSARDVTDYKRIEGVLRESEERFRSISLLTSDMVYSCDHHPGRGFEIAWAGGAVERITGYRAEELRAKKCWGVLVAPPDQGIFAANILGLAPGRSSSCEMRLTRKDGSTIWVESKAECLIPETDVPDRRLYGSLVDITARKEAEHALRLSEYQHRIIFQNSPLGMILFDNVGTIVDCNAAFEYLMGSSREQLIGFNTARNSTPEMQTAIKKALEGEVSVFEDEYTSITGGVSRMLRVIFSPILNHPPTGLIATLEDISDRKRMEEALLQEKTILRDILEDILAGYWDWDIDSNQEYLSPSLKRMFGYEDQELPNAHETWFDLILPWDTSTVMEAIKRHVDSRGNRPFNTEVRFRHKDGHIVWVLCAGRVIRWSPTGQPLRMVGCHIDISRQKEVEEALLLAKEEADAANKTKSEFLANMSHELRTPLNGIMGMLQLLEITGMNEEQNDYVSAGMQSCRRLVCLLTDLLDLSRIEAGVLRIQKVPVNLREIFRQTTDLFSPTAKAQGVGLEMLIHPGIPDSLLGDGVRLQQVLTNLVGNALKFTPQGHVVVEASPLPRLKPGICRVLFSVTDSGIGVPDEKIEHIFQPFVQVDMGYSRSYQGAGLGLSICKRLVLLMGGNISMVSELGSGTTMYFTVAFELETEGLDLPPDLHDTILPQFPGRRILLVEDDKFSAAVASKMLQKCGIAVEQAEDGRQALAVLNANRFDAVLMDIRMPIMDGVAAATAIRTGAAGEEAASIPIIALTAHVMEGDNTICLKAGMNGYVSKPVVMNELIAAISKALGKAHD